MKHTINITIVEFIENGGHLKKGREILSDNGVRVGYFEEFENVIPITRNARGTFPTLPHVFYVKIEVNPIYK